MAFFGAARLASGGSVADDTGLLTYSALRLLLVAAELSSTTLVAGQTGLLARARGREI